jgi:hypothetical protein
MFAVARDLYLYSGVFALLAAVLFVVCYDAPAGRMRTFLWLDIRHDNLPFVDRVAYCPLHETVHSGNSPAGAWWNATCKRFTGEISPERLT